MVALRGGTGDGGGRAAPGGAGFLGSECCRPAGAQPGPARPRSPARACRTRFARGWAAVRRRGGPLRPAHPRGASSSDARPGGAGMRARPALPAPAAARSGEWTVAGIEGGGGEAVRPLHGRVLRACRQATDASPTCPDFAPLFSSGYGPPRTPAIPIPTGDGVPALGGGKGPHGGFPPATPPPAGAAAAPAGRRHRRGGKIDGLDYYEYVELIRASSL